MVNATYRYTLTRKLDEEPVGPVCLFVMLNPSTADDTVDDPTIRRCIGFARRWRFGTLEVVNLFAVRATDPRDMQAVDDPVGPSNDSVIRSALFRSCLVVVAWGGCEWQQVQSRADVVTRMILDSGRKPMCLGRTKSGRPRHPLRLRADTSTVEFA